MSNSRKKKQKKRKAKIVSNQHKLNRIRKIKKAITFTEERKLEIENEAKRRMNEWLKNSTFEEMSASGSKMRFDMSLGLLGGYPFEEPDWMLDKSFDDFITDEEFNSPEYEKIIDNLFEKVYQIN